ncbi:polysaccharide biosynthesis tyrosine autokinase [Bythopirellula goksoeyrii]|nr:polysaccharide biosynthesis tyrosine autokinase [Bythopirellula goksoeyrii]
MPAVDAVSAIARFLSLVRRRKQVVITSVVISGLLGMTYYLLATRKYASTAELLIIQQKQDQLATVGDHESSEDTMATHQKLIASPIVLQNAIKRLPPKHRIDLVGEPTHKWVEKLSENLSARVTRKTNFINVSFRSKSPDAAAAVVRAIIHSYLQFVQEKDRGTAVDALHSLLQKGAELEAKLTEKQNELQSFSQAVGHLAVSQDDSAVEPTIQRALRLNDALMDEQQRRLELQATLLSVEGALDRGENIHQYLVAMEESVGRQMMLSSLGLSSEDLNVIEEQQKQILASQAELSSLSKFYGPNHPRILDLQNRIANSQQYVRDYRANLGNPSNGMAESHLGPVVKRMLEQSVQQAWQKEQQMSASFEEARQEAAKHSGDLVQLRMLEREVTRLEAQYDLLFEKISTVNMRQMQAPIQATVVREPVPDRVPVSPQIRFLVFFCLASGTAVGAVIVYVQDVLDDRFSSPEELTAQLGVPVLAMVRNLTPLPGEGMETVHTHTLPHAVETEAFRTLRTAISLSGVACGRLLISSSEPGDGKTTISVNLSVAMAQAGKRTLVIDADLRKPGFTSLLQLRGRPGLADVLTSGLSPAESAPSMVVATEVPGLDVLPVGLRRPNPAELLSSHEFVELLAWADSQYDRVIVDCPPVLAVSDAQVVGQLVDGAILVVRPEKNHRRSVIRAFESFQSVGCNVLGVVANALSDESQSYGYGGYGYGYGYGSDYGSDYGNDEEAFEEEVSDADEPQESIPDPATKRSRTPRRKQGPTEPIRPRRAA